VVLATRQDKEIRTITEKVELRAAEDGKKTIVGYAAKFGMRSQDLGGFVEQIDPHFFDSILNNDTRGLINHDPNLILGRTASGTLKLSVDEFGLRYDIIPPNTSYANDLIVSMERGDISQSSFAFQVDYGNDGDNWEYDEANDIYIRTLLKCKCLYDVSPVTYPAYEQTESIVSSRSVDKMKKMRQLRTSGADDQECVCESCNHSDNCQSTGAKCCICGNCNLVSQCSKPGANGCNCGDCSMAQNNCCETGADNCLCSKCTNTDCCKGHLDGGMVPGSMRTLRNKDYKKALEIKRKRLDLAEKSL
jgi:HK97 family phage prohead protease